MKFSKRLKHTFIPHEDNDYKPHVFRELSLIVILSSSFFLFGASAGSSLFLHKTVLGVSVASSVLIDLTNENRLAYNESPLIKSDILERAATLKANDMVTNGYFAHNSPTGITPWHWFKEAGYKFLYAGENLAINFWQSADVENGWLNSPTHRANLLNKNFKEIGIATKEGVYEGNNTIFVVQMFGTPETLYAIEENKTSTSTTKSVTNDVIAVAPKSDNLPVQGTTQNQIDTSTNTDVINNPNKGEVSGVSLEQPPLLPPVVATSAGTTENTENIKVTTVNFDLTGAAPTYSKWYERILFNGSNYVDTIYRIIITFVSVALIVVLVIEAERKHWKHIIYGIVTLLIILALLYINRGLF